jgi:hypothetical protein
MNAQAPRKSSIVRKPTTPVRNPTMACRAARLRVRRRPARQHSGGAWLGTRGRPLRRVTSPRGRHRRPGRSSGPAGPSPLTRGFPRGPGPDHIPLPLDAIGPRPAAPPRLRAGRHRRLRAAALRSCVGEAQSAPVVIEASALGRHCDRRGTGGPCGRDPVAATGARGRLRATSRTSSRIASRTRGGWTAPRVSRGRRACQRVVPVPRGRDAGDSAFPR